jgi:hypothetical protein
MRDPDAPSGHISLVLEVSQVVDGPGPISVNKLEAVIATVAFSCPADPTQDTFQGTIVFDGLHSTFSVVGGSNAQLTVGVEIDPAHTFLAFGETKEFPFKIESSLGHDADVILQCDQAIAPSFRACPRS